MRSEISWKLAFKSGTDGSADSEYRKANSLSGAGNTTYESVAGSSLVAAGYDGSETIIKRNGVSEAEAKEAVRTLIRWAGDDPERSDLIETPQRVVKAYREFFMGYEQTPGDVLAAKFDSKSYGGQVVVGDIPFHSHCEHHMVPFIGKVHIGYLPRGYVLGLSKLVRLVEIFSRRLQTQEYMTTQIANALSSHFENDGVGVLVESNHLCIEMRGVNRVGTRTYTEAFTGELLRDEAQQQRFLRSCSKK